MTKTPLESVTSCFSSVLAGSWIIY